jgi:hypothetical protein
MHCRISRGILGLNPLDTSGTYQAVMSTKGKTSPGCESLAQGYSLYRSPLITVCLSEKLCSKSMPGMAGYLCTEVHGSAGVSIISQTK